MENKRAGRVRVLIVDDDREVRTALRFSLEKRKFMVEEAKNGQEALEKVFISKPDIIILDGNMPVMDGFETCQRLREDSKTNGIPIIFCSAMHILEMKKRKIEVDDYLEKPFFMGKLLSKIDKILRRNSGDVIF